jgi:hypothetical protein
MSDEDGLSHFGIAYICKQLSYATLYRHITAVTNAFYVSLMSVVGGASELRCSSPESRIINFGFGLFILGESPKLNCCH